MKKIAILLIILATVICLSSCNEDDINKIIERLPYDIELLHEHSWDNWTLVYDEANVNLVCSLCGANVISYSISQGLEIENGVLVGKGTCEDEYVVVPQGVAVIGEGAFANEKNIKGVLLPETVTKIEDNAFKSCDGLQVINIPNGVTEIGEKAFHSCKALIGVLIPHSVTSIGNQAFANCGYLEIIYYVGTEAAWNAVEKGKNWDQGAGKHVVEFKFVIGDDPVPHVHAWSEWTTVKEPTETEEGLKERYCECGDKESESIAKLEAPEGSQGLEYELNEDGQSYSVVGIGTCTDTELVIPSMHEGLPVTSVGQNAFINNIDLTSVTILDNLQNIERWAFGNCTSLVKVTLGKDVQSVHYKSFGGCGSLKEYDVDENNPYFKQLEGNIHSKDGKTFVLYAKGKDATSFTVSNGIEIIYQDAFSEAKSLKEVNIPKSVIEIQKYAFWDCEVLNTFNYYGTVQEWMDINKDSLWDATLLDYTVYCLDGKIAKDGKITYYEDELEGSQGLEYELNEDGQSYSVVGIGTCTDTDVIIPEAYNGLPVTALAEKAFNSCNTIVSIVIPESVITIGRNALAACDFLAKVSIPSSVVYIGSQILRDSPSLMCIEVNEDNLYYKSIDGNLYSEDGTEFIKYASAKTDSDFEIPNGVVTIKVCAFSDCTTIKRVVFPDSVSTIEELAFYKCTSLEYVDLSSNITYIGRSAFNTCKSLNNVNLPEGLIELGYASFYQCESLTSLVIPRGISVINRSMFSGCYSLKTIVIPASVTLIDKWSFTNCTALDEIKFEGTLEQWNNIQFGVSWKNGAKKYILYCTDGEHDSNGPLVPKHVDGSWSVIGNMKGTEWGVDFQMTEICDGIFHSELLYFNANEKFKIRKDGSWDVNYGFGGLSDGANCSVSSEGYYIIEFVWYGMGENPEINLIMCDEQGNPIQ